jgi:hypothetical protein
LLSPVKRIAHAVISHFDMQLRDRAALQHISNCSIGGGLSLR